jgi:hypothetical protein
MFDSEYNGKVTYEQVDELFTNASNIVSTLTQLKIDLDEFRQLQESYTKEQVTELQTNTELMAMFTKANDLLESMGLQ